MHITCKHYSDETSTMTLHVEIRNKYFLYSSSFVNSSLLDLKVKECFRASGVLTFGDIRLRKL